MLDRDLTETPEWDIFEWPASQEEQDNTVQPDALTPPVTEENGDSK